MSFLPNKLLLNIFACGLVLSCPIAETSAAQAPAINKNGPVKTLTQWSRFTSNESGFSVELPSKPEHIQQTIDIPKSDLKISYDTFISEPNESAVYVVSVWNYPAEIDMSKPEVNLQDGFGGMLAALPGSEVLNMQMTEVQGFKALEFLVKNEDIYFQGKLILVYNTLYQVFTVYKGSQAMGDSYKRFINSFQLIKPESHKVAPKGGNGKRVNV